LGLGLGSPRELKLNSLCGFHDEQQWQASGWNGASVLQKAPHLRFRSFWSFADYTASMFFGMKQSRHSQIALKAAQGDNRSNKS
jgi:hypothetical protein